MSITRHDSSGILSQAVEHAIAVPRGNSAALGFAAAFVEEQKRSGAVARAIERNGIRGVEVAPPAKR